MWHYQGGNCQVLEDELVLANPPHDDCKDALAAAVDVAIAPTFMMHSKKLPMSQMVHTRFGGIM
jgi:hypothetical protein